MKILLTNAGRRTYIVDYLFKLKDEYDPKIEVFVTDTSENTASFWVDKRLNKFLTPRVGLSDKKYLNSLIKLCKKNKIDILIPLMDYELHILAKNKKLFESNGTSIIISDYGTVLNFLDKEKNHKLCLKNNLKVPKLWKNFSQIPAQKKIVVKKKEGSGSEDTYIDYKKNLPQHKFDKSYIIQDYIKGQEYGMDILNDLNGKFIHCCVKKKISMRSGETDKAEVVFSKRFTNIGRKISLIFKHVGNLDLDFIVDLKNDIYFLDFNPRFGGGYPFTHLAGYNYLQYIIKFFKKEKFEVSNIKNDNFIASKGLTIFKSHKYNKKKLAIIGAGGHGKVVGEIALLNGFEVVDFFDKQSRQIIQFPYEIVGNINMLYKKLENYNSFFVAIGDNNLRYYYLKDLIKKKLNISILIHPKATISKHSKLGVGSCVMANAVINPGVKINKGVIINTSASIDHDCQIDDYSHISPNCSLSGNVKVGKFTHLGTATSVHPGINIGKNVKSGIGAKIFRNILSNNIIKN